MLQVALSKPLWAIPLITGGTSCSAHLNTSAPSWSKLAQLHPSHRTLSCLTPSSVDVIGAYQCTIDQDCRRAEGFFCLQETPSIESDATHLLQHGSAA